MNYINTQTMDYPLSEYQVRALFPQTSFPKNFVAPDGFAKVFTTPYPSYDPMTQAYRELTPQQVGGEWVQVWEVYALDAATIAANQAQALENLQNTIAAQTQARLDNFARTRNYDGILSLCTYASSAVPKFAAEGQYGVNARDATWAKLYEMLAEVEAGTRPVPAGFADIEPELPVLAWPE